jgi:ribokinase
MDTKSENISNLDSVLVLGSLNVDFVAYCIDDQLPLPGQTVIGTLFEKNYGGKGANQAVQVSRSNCPVTMLGKVGPDDFGKNYLEHLKTNENVNIKYINKAYDVSTGIAQITVSSAGENCIIIIPGANNEVDIEYAEDALNAALTTTEDTSSSSSSKGKPQILLLQNEIPLETSIYAMRWAHENNIRCIFNPAPAPSDPTELRLLYSSLKSSNCMIDIICPNETELASLTGTYCTAA